MLLSKCAFGSSYQTLLSCCQSNLELAWVGVLVGGFNPWKILVRLDHHPNYWVKITNVPNHQPGWCWYVPCWKQNSTVHSTVHDSCAPGHMKKSSVSTSGTSRHENWLLQRLTNKNGCSVHWLKGKSLKMTYGSWWWDINTHKLT